VLAQRLQGLGTSVFRQMDDLRKELETAGRNLINLSIGSPDRAPSLYLRQVLSAAVLDEKFYGYTLSRGTTEFRRSCCTWYKRRFNVELDPEKEVLPLMGSQDGLAHIFMTYIDPGDLALIPDPGYPIYSVGLHLAGGQKVSLPLLPEQGFLPDLTAVKPDIARQAKILFLNYPNNPTAATAPLAFFDEVVAFAREYDILICHDAAYSELAFAGYRPASFLQARNAREVGVEFHSISKTYNLAGTRLGFVVGKAEVISALALLKENIDYGVFEPVLKTGTAALLGDQEDIKENCLAYQRRRDIWIKGCAEVGWIMPTPRCTMFVWAPVPTKQDSISFAECLAREAGVLVVPGVAFGSYGEGFIRIALVQNEDMMREAVWRIRKYLGS
jgi:LL-diaminopimelate aminotransferase